MQQLLNKITRYGLYALAFLIPFFFWPSTHSPILANKQLLVAVLCGLLLLVWVIKVMATGKARFKWSKIATAVLLLLLVLGVSTAFSTARAQSFFGMAFEGDTFFSFILYVLIFLLFSNLVESKTQAVRIIKAFLAGTGVLAVLFLVSTLFGSFFPWEFAKVAGFNPVGTLSVLAMLFGGALVIDVLLIAECLKNPGKCRKLAFVAEIVIGILLLAGIVLLNHWAVWVVVGLSCLLIVWIKGFSKEAVLPVCLLVLALLFVTLNIPTNRLVDLPAEAALTYQSSFNIAKETLFQGIDEFLLGSGPSTFAMDYDLFQPLGINLSGFWQARFTQGVAVFLTILATSGVLGLLALLFLVARFFGAGFRAMLFRGAKQAGEGLQAPQAPQAPLAVFVGGFYFLLAWFFSPVNFSLMFFAFLILGLWTAISKGRTAGFELKNMQPQYSFFIMLLCILLVVGVVVGLYRVGRNYAAALVFQDGIEFVQGPEQDLEKGIEKLTWAAETAQNDTYYRNLSQAFLARIAQVVNDTTMAPESKQELLQGLIDAAEDFAGRAIVINQKNSQNWLNSADIYLVLARDLGVSGAENSAISAYEQAKTLAPKNPALFYKSAVINVLSAERLKAQFAALQASGQENADLARALSNRHQERIGKVIEDLQKALQLKPDYAEAAQLLSLFVSQ